MYVCIVTVDVQILIMSSASHLQCGKELHVYIYMSYKRKDQTLW